jgi:VWFA-related protein
VRLALAAALAFTCVAAPHGQTDQDTPRVRLNAVVVNDRGEPVAGLRAADFELVDEGVTQQIDDVEYRTGPTEPRAIGLFLDEFHIDHSDSFAVRDAVAAFLDHSVRSTDVLAILKPLNSLTSIPLGALTDDMRQAVAGFSGRKGDYTPRSVFEEKYMAQAPGAVATARAQIVTSGVRALASRLEEAPGRRAIVLVSDGFARIGRADRERPASLEAAIRFANRADVAVYVVAPGTLRPAADSSDAERAAAAVQALATQTGGDVLLTDVAASFKRIGAELGTYYVVSYRPSQGEDGRFHQVKLTVPKKRQTLVRARTGYQAAMSAEMRAALAARYAPLPPARVVKRSALIRSWSGVTRAADGGARVTMTWEPTTTIPGKAAAALLVSATTPGGKVLYEGKVAPAGGRPSSTVTDRVDFDAPPGRIWIDVTILAADGKVLEADARDVDVPDLSKAQGALLTPAIVRARSAREFREMRVDPSVAPIPSRDFRRSDRLLIRVPASAAESSSIGAVLLNRWHQPMRALEPMRDRPPGDTTQFDLPLAPLAPGEYAIRLTNGTSSETVTFRVAS